MITKSSIDGNQKLPWKCAKWIGPIRISFLSGQWSLCSVSRRAPFRCGLPAPHPPNSEEAANDPPERGRPA